MKAKILAPLDPLQRYTVNEACDYLRISRAHLYKQINNGSLPKIDDGKRTFIPGAAIAARSRLPDEAVS